MRGTMAFLKGVPFVRHTPNGPEFILESGSVGSLIQLSACDHAEFLRLAEDQEEFRCWIYHEIKEGVESFFGFLSSTDLDLFLVLIECPGIGPGTAQQALAIGSQRIRKAKGHKDLLTKGIGKTTAEKLLAFLREAGICTVEAT
jgi:Holliday junction resolvasome RuvABC DNA-binding subunit